MVYVNTYVDTLEVIDLGNGAEMHEDAEGTVIYYLNGKYHRTDGPAFIHAEGHKCWYVHDKLHRLDGPAVVSECGDFVEYWIDDIQYSEEEFELIKQMLWAL